MINKTKAIKVSNPSKYWTSFEAERCVYYHFVWGNGKAIKTFIENEIEILKEYKTIADKYGIAIPNNSRIDKSLINKNHLYDLFLYQNEIIYPSKIFIDTLQATPEKIISINPIINTNGIIKNNYFSPPIRVEIIKNEKEIKFLTFIDNDLFLLEIDNKKTKAAPTIGGKGNWIDNSDLAYLNTPRLNSFLRDFKQLSIEFGATKIEFENLGIEEFSEKGVLFNKEIVYYEDILEILDKNHRIG